MKVSKPITICPEVIAEIHGQLISYGRLLNTERGIFWKFAQEELKQLGIEEEMFKLVNMDSTILQSHGPVDTAIYHLAIKMRKPVFTTERKLQNFLKEREISYIDIYTIQELWKKYGNHEII